MLSAPEAELLVERHLGGTPRAAHSRLVAYLMCGLAGTFSADIDLWEIVGLCHDLDFLQTAADPSRHGLLTVEWLVDSIPIDAQAAIAAHDHRTGDQADTLLADMLKLADAIAIIDQRVGRRKFCSLDPADPYSELRDQLRDRSYLGDILQRYASKCGLSFARIAEMVAAAPSQ